MRAFLMRLCPSHSAILEMPKRQMPSNAKKAHEKQKKQKKKQKKCSLRSQKTQLKKPKNADKE